MTTTPTISKEALAVVQAEWSGFCLDRLMNEAFWTACDDFINEEYGAGADFTDEEREAIHQLIQERTKVSVSLDAPLAEVSNA